MPIKKGNIKSETFSLLMFTGLLVEKVYELVDTVILGEGMLIVNRLHYVINTFQRKDFTDRVCTTLG